MLAAALVLGACSKPGAPALAPVQGAPAPTTPGITDPSVPDAGSVLAPAATTPTNPAAERSNGPMSPVQESGAMPLPGQNNDHSAPLLPAKRASAP
jgi:hypothetical protein